MRAVPHLRVFLKARMDISTSTVILLGFGSLGLSLKYSLLTCLARFNHLCTVCLVVSNSSAILVTAKPFLTSFPNIPLILGANLTTTPSKQLCPFQQEKRNVRKLTLHILCSPHIVCLGVQCVTVQ